MLQVITKMYFRPGVPLHSTTHREVLYTNLSFLRRDTVPLPLGELTPSTGSVTVSSVTASLTEHLEAKQLDGSDSILISTSGGDVIEDLADVLSFGLNATLSRDIDLVRRLVPASASDEPRGSAATLFRDTFAPARYITDDELTELRAFMTQLLALERPHFEAAMKAIRRIVRACRRGVDDPTLAYTEMVAALESLSKGASAPAPTWQQIDGRKRKLFDKALHEADEDVAERVRQALMEAEHAGLKNRFVQFVLANVSPKFFRAEATNAIRPIRRPDLTRAIKLAYDLRSRNVHMLWELPPEAYELGDRAETVSPPKLGTMLSLEGMARLSRHVIRAYVDAAPTGVDSTFEWRKAIPGVLQMQLAPQYWIHSGAGFDARSAPRYFAGFLEHLIEVLAGRAEAVTDINPVLERIEKLAGGTSDTDTRAAMVAIYALWHRFLSPDHHRSGAGPFVAKHNELLKNPSMAAFVVGLLTDPAPDWTSDQWLELAEARRAEQMSSKVRLLPASIEAALQVVATQHLLADGRRDEALGLLDCAIDELPGNELLIDWEAKLRAGEAQDLDVSVLVLGPSKGPEPETEVLQSAEDTPAEGAPSEEAPAEGAPAEDATEEVGPK